MVSRLTWVRPKVSWILSNSWMTRGIKSSIHSTAAAQATQDTTRSTMRMVPECGKASVSTRAQRRMTASDRKIGTAICRTNTAWYRATTARAAYTKMSASTGNSTPSTVLRPNQTEWAAWPRPTR